MMRNNNSNWGSGNLNTNNSKHNNEATITFDTPEKGDSVDPSDMRHGKQASAQLLLDFVLAGISNVFSTGYA